LEINCRGASVKKNTLKFASRISLFALFSAFGLGACTTTGEVSHPVNKPTQNQTGNIPTLPSLPPVSTTPPMNNVVTAPQANGEISFARAGFKDLPNWSDTDIEAARQAFRNSCDVMVKRDETRYLSEKIAYAGKISDWKTVCSIANNPDTSSRTFFENNFTPWRLSTKNGGRGKLTSYFEPVLRASFTKTNIYNEPLYGKPDDLITINLSDFDPSLAGKNIVGRINGNNFIPYRKRGEISATNAPIIAWTKMGEALSLQIQGSGRLLFDNGQQLRAAFVATNGQPFGSVARELIKRGQLPQSQASADNITKWFEQAAPNNARSVINANPRTTFFELQNINNPSAGPKGSQGVPLVAGGSLAIDPSIHAYGVPIFIFANASALGNSLQNSLTRLVITQDTGGAIKGPIRGDLYYGTGEEAGFAAGRINHEADWWILLPNGVDPTKK
jgi:membrane-bound lytic murein transglycosylase A